MSLNTRIFIVNNIKISVNASHEEAFSVAERKLKRLNVNLKNAKFSIFKKSVDARRKNDIKFVYSVAVETYSEKNTDFVKKDCDVAILNTHTEPDVSFGNEFMSAPPLIVGSGPCGLFAALMLAENGYRPVIIERGGSIQERESAVARFNSSQILDIDTNIQFGAGGAGTFSDGKLITRINDPFSSYVLKKLVDFGAPKEILYAARPHIGTDVLAPTVERIISEIERLGGKILYHTKYISSVNGYGKSYAVTNKGDIPYSALILAIGHSARDTYQNLLESGFCIEAKPFSVGMRIEHLSCDIDRALYGDFAGHHNLGHAEYNLSYNTKERGVYTFCMCPGGEVVAAASEVGGVVVNGMSLHKRNGNNSNSAIVCSIFKEDYGNTPQKAIEFQRNIEKAAFIAGGSDYRAPMITVGDFLSNKCSTEPYKVIPTYMKTGKTKICSPYEYLPNIVCDSIKNALIDFDKKINGFTAPYAVLTGAETRTSAPVRILRNTETRIALGSDNVYPCGEGAGYAGGITSSAIDGIKTAIAIMKRYNPIICG